MHIDENSYYYFIHIDENRYYYFVHIDENRYYYFMHIDENRYYYFMHIFPHGFIENQDIYKINILCLYLTFPSLCPVRRYILEYD